MTFMDFFTEYLKAKKRINFKEYFTALQQQDPDDFPYKLSLKFYNMSFKCL